jgi:large subunit ribosomal protein L21
MFAVIKTGGKQYKVALDSILNVEALNAEEGTEITLNEVLMVENDGNVVLQPKSSTVKALVVSNFRGEKVIAFKKRRRHTYKRTKGHRQYLTRIKIISIEIN